MAIENFSRHAGGAESYAVELARTMVSQGWEVHLYGHSWDREPDTAVFHPMPRLPKWIPPSVRILHFALTHRRMVKGQGFDIVLGFGNTITMNMYQSHGGVHRVSNLRKLEAVRNPLVRFIKALAVFGVPKYYARAWIESAAFRMNQPPVIIAISDMVRNDMAERFGIDKEQVRLVYNGIDQARFRTRDEPQRRNLREKLGFKDEILFLFMAYDFRKKGVRYLLEAAGELRARVGPGRFGAVIVGRSPSPSLQRRVSHLDLADIVRFPGPTKEPEAYYHACDVFVLPTFYDACSLVVFEAMAAGLPAITSVFNGAAGIIEHGVDGMVIKDPRNTKEMADAMERFLDPNILESAGAAARRTASKYTLEANHKQMIDIMREVVRRESRL
ncbi:MAG: glycosyltransferase family 4 protein [Desulfomonile tiedjei]|nr:glycosyltransferase family 4 protein [Desulfomonile tiedjei]